MGAVLAMRRIVVLFLAGLLLSACAGDRSIQFAQFRQLTAGILTGGTPQVDLRTTLTPAALEQINGLVERWVRERPEQWFWIHRRWPD